MGNQRISVALVVVAVLALVGGIYYVSVRPSADVVTIAEVCASGFGQPIYTAAPGTPSGSAGSDSVAWSWTAPTGAQSKLPEWELIPTAQAGTGANSQACITDYTIDVGTTAGGSDVASGVSAGTDLAHTVSGLGAGTYYARAKAVWTMTVYGQASSTFESPWSSNSSGVVIAAPADTTAPTISSLSVSGVSTSSATITWTTNEAATSQVKYGTSAGSLSSQTTATSSTVTSHSVTLSGLSAGTTYYLQAVSADAAGNSATSSQTSFSTEAAATSATPEPPAPPSTPTTTSSPTPEPTPTTGGTTPEPTPTTSTQTSPTTSSSATSSSSSSASPTSTSSATKPAPKPVPAAEEVKAGSLNVFGIAHVGLPKDTITEVKTVTTLPEVATTVALAPAKSVSTATATFQGQAVDVTTTEAGEYQVSVTAPGTANEAFVEFALSYADATSETIPVTVATVAPGTVADGAGQPVAGISVTLYQVSETGTTSVWDPGETGQSNPALTNAQGQYGFVVAPGNYQVVASATEYQSATSETVTVGPQSGPVVPVLTLVGAASETIERSFPLWLIWSGLILVLLILFYLWNRSHTHEQTQTRTDGHTPPDQKF